MGITIAELNKKYNAEDRNWNFSLFPKWLQKHGIPDTAEAPIVKLTLEQVLIEFTPETLPEKHHDFDRKVLAIAEGNKAKFAQALTQVLESAKEESLKKYDADWYAKSKWTKIIEVLRGKD